MQFIVIGHDGKDDQAPARRAAARPAHLENSKELQDKKALIHAAAILDDAGQMIGSVMVLDLADRPALDHWLESEPYVTGKVWQKIEVMPAKVGPNFMP
jgi:uncharacterized protein YciI